MEISLLFYFGTVLVVSIGCLLSPRFRAPATRIVAACSALNAVAFLAAVLPDYFGYQGTEAYRWAMFYTALVTGFLGILLGAALTLLVFMTWLRARGDEFCAPEPASSRSFKIAPTTRGRKRGRAEVA